MGAIAELQTGCSTTSINTHTLFDLAASQVKTETKKMGCKEVALFILLNITLFFLASSHAAPCPPTRPLPSSPNKCSRDALKFGVCGSWFGLVNEVIGEKPSDKCCTLIQGVADLEAAFCLCTAIKANILGTVKFEVPVAFSLIFNACGGKVPEGFVCG